MPHGRTFGPGKYRSASEPLMRTAPAKSELADDIEAAYVDDDVVHLDMKGEVTVTLLPIIDH